MKVSELEGVALDYWVARAEGQHPEDRLQFQDKPGVSVVRSRANDLILALDDVSQSVEVMILRGRDDDHQYGPYSPSTDWAQGGPIIETMLITIAPFNPAPDGDERTQWAAFFTTGEKLDEPRGIGATPLIAAMRAYVTGAIGEDVLP